MESITLLWFMMLGAKYMNTNPLYANAINQAYSAAAKQSGMEQNINKAQSYATNEGRQIVSSTGVDPIYPGAVAYAYRIYASKSVEIPIPTLPTGCKPSLHATNTGASLNLTWHF